MFVLDASMAAAWHFKDEETAATAAIEALTDDTPVVVPAHWFAEVANSLLVGERKKRATAAETAQFVTRLQELMIVEDDLSSFRLFDRILPLARAHRLTIYDTLYLELAERRGLPLASLDGPLCKAAHSIGVALVTVE